MKMTNAMMEFLSEIRSIESVERISELEIGSDELGNRLIDLYYESDNLRTRELITLLLKRAGFVWLRKLITRDTNPAAAPDGTFASLEDFISMIAANDAVSSERKSG
ncbi:MAG: hypothetical protein HKN50_06180 [Gammaproteobacteria bacterium]|nr:hypothetical protein [Gammaproteobacteria bacterium]